MTDTEFQNEAKRLLPWLRNIAKGYMGSRQEAEDVVQDVLIRLWQTHDELHVPIDSLSAVVLRNCCISAIRRRKPTVSMEEFDASSDETNGNLVELMLSLIDKLPPMQQLVVRLRHLSGMEMAEIAALTGKSEEAVRQLLSRGRRQLRQLMIKEMRKE